MMVSIGDGSYVAWREDSEEQEAIRVSVRIDVFRPQLAPGRSALAISMMIYNTTSADILYLSVTLVPILFIVDESLIIW
jgi:hypothetical protein